MAVFRRFATEHPILFRIGVQRTPAKPELAARFEPARVQALSGLEARIRRLQRPGLLDGRTVRDATYDFHAFCEGLAGRELRGAIAPDEEERIWRDALAALVTGLAVRHGRVTPMKTSEEPSSLPEGWAPVGLVATRGSEENEVTLKLVRHPLLDRPG